MTATVLTTTTRPTHGTGVAARPRANVFRPLMAGCCPGEALEQDCPFCSGPETD